MAIKLRALVKHPSRLEGDTGIDVTKANGVATVALDLGAFAATASIADPQRTAVLLVTPGLADEDADVVERMAADDFLSLALNFDAELAAIAGLASAADRLPYFTGTGTAALAEFTAFGRSLVDDADAGAALATLGVSAFAQTVLEDTTAAAALTTLGVSTFAQTILDDANAATARATLGLVIGTDVQPQDAELAALAGLTSAADKAPYFTGSGTAALADLTSFGRSLIDDANASAARTTLGLVIGTNVQAQDAELAALAGLTSAADKLPYFTGAGTAALADCTSFGRSLIDDANASAARTTLGLAIGTDVQAFNARLADIAGATYAQGNVLYHNGSNLVVLAPGTNGQFLKTQGASANPVWSNVPGGGDLLATNNLSDLANAATAFGNIKQAATAGTTGVVRLADATALAALTAGMVLTADLGIPRRLNFGTVVSASTLDIVLTSYSGFRCLMFYLGGCLPATDGAQLYMRFSTDGGSSYDASGYNYAGQEILDNSITPSVFQSGSANQIVISNGGVGNASTSGYSGEIRLLKHTSTSLWSRIFHQGYFIDDSVRARSVTGGGAREAAQDTDAVRFLFASGSIASCDWAVYGIP